MKTLLTLLAIIVAPALFAQGLEEEFDQACKCWTVTNHYDNGQVSMIHHENEQRQKDGTLKHYSTDGKLLREEEWNDGMLDGTSKHYHPDGSLYLEATYDMGAKKGTWRFLDGEGDPTQEIAYTGKGSDGLYSYYHAGVKYAEQVIKDGKLVDTQILNQEIYDVVQEEAAATEK